MTTSSPAVTELPMSDWAIPDRVALPKDTLRMRLDIYQDSIILNSYIGHTVHTRMISANDAASALTQHMGITTGLLPEAALWINTSGPRQDDSHLATPGHMASGTPRESPRPSSAPRPPHARACVRMPPEPTSVGLRSKGQTRLSHGPTLPRTRLQRLPRRTCVPSTHSSHHFLPGGPLPSPNLLLPLILLPDGRHPRPFKETPNRPEETLDQPQWQTKIPPGRPTSLHHRRPSHATPPRPRRDLTPSDIW